MKRLNVKKLEYLNNNGLLGKMKPLSAEIMKKLTMSEKRSRDGFKRSYDIAKEEKRTYGGARYDLEDCKKGEFF